MFKLRVILTLFCVYSVQKASLCCADDEDEWSTESVGKLTRLETERNPATGYTDLYIASTPEYGIYQAPTWLGVYTDTDETNLTGAQYAWNSGLEWFGNINLDEWMIGGKYIALNISIIEVAVTLADGQSITLYARLPRKEGCWTDWENWTSQPFVDDNGNAWPLTQLQFDFPALPMQNVIYQVPGTSCRSTLWTENPSLWCEGIAGSISVSAFAVMTWPTEEVCMPAGNHAVDYIYFTGKGGDGIMYLFMNGVKQKFKGTPVALLT